MSGETTGPNDEAGLLAVVFDWGGTLTPWHSIDLREQWKQQAIAFWADRAHSQGKDLWLAEMQAQPWGDSSTFSPADLIESAIDYRQEPLQVVLMWGVDTWLNDPEWLAAGTQAMEILRAG